MLRVKRTHRWIFVAVAALLSFGYMMDVPAAIAPWHGNCKPVSSETPADGKDKAPKPGKGDKGDRSGEKAKGDKAA